MNYSIIVKRLIGLRHEGDRWDFKRQWHDNAAELVHDIICMANSPADGEKFIIIGVDEENAYDLVDITKDEKRKNTSGLNSLLRNVKFVGGMRPFVRVESIMINGKLIDVIVIENSENTPFVLSEDYSSGAHGNRKTVKQGNIYTRIGDANTPFDKTADNDIAEKLWRRRFRLDKAPLERINHYLRDVTGWGSDENEETFYYKYAPEYTIFFDYEQEDHARNQDFLCRMYIDKSGTYNTASIKVYGATIRHIDYVYLDGSRFATVRPNYYHIMPGSGFGRDNCFFMVYLDADSIEYAFYLFLITHLPANESYQREEWLNHVIIFRNGDERRCFIEYVRENFAKLRKKSKGIKNRLGETRYEGWNQYDDEDWRQTKFLATEYREWVKNNDNITNS